LLPSCKKVEQKRLRPVRQSRRQQKQGVSIGAVMSAVFADIPAQKLRWLWPGRVPLGKLTLFAGDPGLGKSLVTLDNRSSYYARQPVA